MIDTIHLTLDIQSEQLFEIFKNLTLRQDRLPVVLHPSQTG